MGQTGDNFLGIDRMVSGANSGTWGSITNDNWDRISGAVSGYNNIELTGLDPETVVDTPAYSNPSLSDGLGWSKFLKFSDADPAPTGTAVVIIKNGENDPQRLYFIQNATSISLNIKYNASGLELTLGAGRSTVVLCDGTNIVKALANFEADLIGDVTGNADTATLADVATKATVTQVTTNALHPVAFFDSGAGNLDAKTSLAFAWNPATKELSLLAGHVNAGTYTGALNDGVTAVTQDLDDYSTKVATTKYVDTQVSAQDLDFAGNSGGDQSVDLVDEKLIIEGGEGIDTTGSAQKITIAGQLASTSNKGIAKFDADNFSVSSGDVSIKAGGVDLGNEVAGTLPVANGGTGAASLTDGGLLLGNGTGAVTVMSVLGDGEMIVGDGTTDPAVESGAALRTSIGVGTGDSPTLTGLTITGTGASSLDVGGGLNIGTENVALVGTDGKISGPLSGTIIDDLSGANLTNLDAGNVSSGTLAVARGGTGATSIADKAVLISQDSGTDAVGSVALTDSGGLIIGGTSGPAAGTITGDDGISVTNGDGSIELDLDLKANGGCVIDSNELAIDLAATGFTNTLPNTSLANSTVSYGGVELALGGADATPSFNLSDAGSYTGDGSLVTTGALDSGSITSGFGSIDTGDSTISSGGVTLVNQGSLKLEDSDGDKYVALESHTAVSDSYTLTFPPATGSADQILKTNGSGELAWTANSGGGGSGDVDSVSAASSGGLVIDPTTGSVVASVSLDNLTAATVNVATDSMAIIDADASNGTRKESIADLVGGIAGTGLSASGGVLSFDGSTITEVGALDSGSIVSGFTTIDRDRTEAKVISVSGSSGIAASDSSGAVTLSLDLDTLAASDGSGVDGGDRIASIEDGEEVKAKISGIRLSKFNNDEGWTSNTGVITGVTAGTNLNGSTDSGVATVNLDTTLTGLTSVASTGFTGALTGNADTATTATNVVAAAVGADASCRVAIFESPTGTVGAKTDSGLAYNAVSKKLTTTTFNGELTGNATSASTLSPGRTINGESFDGSQNITIAVNASELDGNTINNSVLYSSLREVGNLSGGSIVSGFGDINIGTNIVTAHAPTQTAGNNTTSIATTEFVTTAVAAGPAMDADSLTGTVLASNVTASSITGTGALTSGSIASGFGNIDVGSSNITTSGTLTADLTGNADTATTVTAAAQPSITSVGTLAGLEVVRGGDIKLDGYFPVSGGGLYNVAIGKDALDSLTTGDSNIASGGLAGKELSIQNANVLIGTQAGQHIASESADTGDNNTLVGHQAGKGNGTDANTSTDNTAVGSCALEAIEGGTFNAFLGKKSAFTLTDGDYNSGVGFQAGSAITDGSSNTCLGSGSGKGVTGGSHNVCIGVDSGDSNGELGSHRLVIHSTGSGTEDPVSQALIYGNFDEGTLSTNSKYTPLSTATPKVGTNYDGFTIKQHDASGAYTGSALNIETDIPVGANDSDNGNLIKASILLGPGAGGRTVKFKVTSNGSTYTAGALHNTGADFAEMFEWADGNPDDEDRTGLSVVLDGQGGVRFSVESDSADDVIGVVSATACLIGNDAWGSWDQKFLKDDFGRTTDELNPDFDSSIEYVPRQNRQEWAIIGLTGRIHLRTGSLTNPLWRKIRTVSSVTEEWLIR